MTHVNSEAEKDILRFIVAMAQARDDEDAVKQVIDQYMSRIDPYLHATLLKVTMRVLVAQFYAPIAHRLDNELGYPHTWLAIERQRRLNDGIADDDEDDDEDQPARPNLALVSADADPKVIRP